MIVKRILDVLPSKTANMLRLDRFTSWYENQLHGWSPYEDKLEALLVGNRQGIDRPEHMNAHYRMMRAYNPLSLAFRSAFLKAPQLTKLLDINPRGGDQDLWHSYYRRGISPLESKKAMEVYRKWSIENDLLYNGGVFLRLQDDFDNFIRRGISHLIYN
jgi:hypothetical protein